MPKKWPSTVSMRFEISDWAYELARELVKW